MMDASNLIPPTMEPPMPRLALPLVLAAAAVSAGPAHAADASRTTHLSFERIVIRAANATAHGDATIRTPASWPRKTPDRHRAVFGPLPVAGGCTATATVGPDVAASRSTAKALAAQAVPSGETVRQGGGATSAWRVGAAAAGVESPMRVYAWRFWRVAPRRFAAIRVNVQFAQGCPSGAIKSPALHDAIARVARTAQVDVRFSPRRAMASAAAAGGLPVSPGHTRTTGPLGVQLVKPPATFDGCPERIQIGARNTAASRARHVYAVRAFRVRPDGTGKFRINRVLFNEERDPSLRGWRYGTLRGICDDFAVLYQIHVRRPGHPREIVKQRFRVQVTQ